MKGRGGDSLLLAYCLATSVFAVLDFGFATPIRAVGIESPGLRLAYYVRRDVTSGLGDVRSPSGSPWGRVPPTSPS